MSAPGKVLPLVISNVNKYCSAPFALSDEDK